MFLKDAHVQNSFTPFLISYPNKKTQFGAWGRALLGKSQKQELDHTTSTIKTERNKGILGPACLPF